MPPDPTITVDRELDQAAQEAVRRLVADSAAVDGSSGLNESALLHLKHPGDGVRHVQATRARELIGYAQLEAGGGQTTGQLIVAPEHRRQGVGTLLVQRMLPRRSLRCRSGLRATDRRRKPWPRAPVCGPGARC
jgi:mycothiol synthase